MNRRLKKVLVFGATSAIAQAALRELVARGSSVYCVGRDPARLDALLADLRVRGGPAPVIAGEVADLLDTARHPALFAAAESRIGPPDAVLIAHGILPDQARAEVSADAAISAIAVNATSVVSLLTIAAGLFEARGSGVIAVITSVAGDRGRRSNYVYGSAKSLVSTFLQGLRLRLEPAGVRVLDIKPGFVRTPMTAHLPQKGPLWADAGAVVATITRAMERRSGIVYVPWFWYWIMLVIRHIPEPLFRKLRI
jgi:NAD(P)-dependent dehydrogenase (short-subunit alcohol dehydrogenase family)